MVGYHWTESKFLSWMGEQTLTHMCNSALRKPLPVYQIKSLWRVEKIMGLEQRNKIVLLAPEEINLLSSHHFHSSTQGAYKICSSRSLASSPTWALGTQQLSLRTDCPRSSDMWMTEINGQSRDLTSILWI